MRPRNLLRFPAVNISTLCVPSSSSSSPRRPSGFSDLLSTIVLTLPLHLALVTCQRRTVFPYITADGLCKNNPWVIYRVPLDKWLSLARYIKRFL